MKKKSRIIVVVITYAILIFSPVIPITSAPVIPNPIYTLRMISLFRLIWMVFIPFVGVSYRGAWSTFVAISILLAVGGLMIVWAFKGPKDGITD